MQKEKFNYRTILNNISDKIFYLDADFNVNWANQAAVKYFDLNIEAMKDQKCFKKWKQNKKCKDCPVIKAKETKNIEECILEKDDDKRWKIKAIPEINKAGEIEAMIEIVSDMTASKDISDKEKVEKEIEETKNLLQSLTNKTPGAVFQHRLLPNGTYLFTYASEDIYEIYEVTPEEAKADANKVIDRIHSEDYELVADSIKESAENLTVWEEEYRVELPEKGIRWIEGYAEPEKRPDGSVVWYGNIRDITKRKEKESKLQKQKEKYKEAKKSLENLSNLAPGVTHQYRLFPDGTFYFPYISEGLFEIYELTAAEVKKDAAKLFERIHPADYDRVVRLILNSAKKLSVWEAEFRVILPEKGLRWVEAKAKPERLSDNSILWYGNSHDITKRKKQEQKLNYQHKFTQKLAEISTDLLEINLANIDRKINHSLEKIGKFFDVDRSYIIQLSENKFLSNTHE